MSRLVAMVLCAQLSCSLSIRGPDPRRPPSLPPLCETSAPGRLLIDGVAGAILLMPLLVILGMHEGQCESEKGCDDVSASDAAAGVVVLSIPTAIYWGSAVVGYKRTLRCRETVQRYHEQRAQPGPRRWRSPSQP